jgi:hypothetical protein
MAWQFPAGLTLSLCHWGRNIKCSDAIPGECDPILKSTSGNGTVKKGWAESPTDRRCNGLNLDALLLYKTTFLGMFGNEILKGLEDAAKLGFANLKDTGQAVDRADLQAKTDKIRQTLAEHYITKVGEYQGQIAANIFPVIIGNMKDIQQQLEAHLNGHYRPALEVAQAAKTEREFEGIRRDREQRSRRLRETIDQIEQLAKDMAGVLAGWRRPSYT